MKNLSAYLLTAVLGLSVLSGCKDDDDDAAPSKTSQLTAKSWRPTAVTITSAGISTNVIDFLYPAPCNKDNFIKFNTDKSATYDEGPLRCDASAPQTEKGSWEFTTNETKLKLTNPEGDVVEGTIVTLNSTTLVLNGSVEVLGIATPGELTFTAQ